jgi:hypothetical protein
MRLGDEVDDYCSRCKRTQDHLIVSMVGDDAKMVRCRTCAYEHTYRHNRTVKKEMTAKDAFDQVLASVMGSTPGLAPDPPKKRKKK